jgi:hypothetical protein
MISSALLTNVEHSFRFTVEIYEKLIGSLTTFYEESKAPSMLKSFVFTLLSRLVIKLRHIYSKELSILPGGGDMKNKIFDHFKRIFVKKEFIETLFSELLVHKEQQEHALQFSLTKQSILYSAFIQDCVELVMIMMMPTVKGASLSSFKDLTKNSGL